MTLKRKERVLCVDDSSETLNSLQFCLKKFGFQVDTFLSSQQALQHMKSHWNVLLLFFLFTSMILL